MSLKVKKAVDVITSCKTCPYKHRIYDSGHKNWRCNINDLYIDIEVNNRMIHDDCTLKNYM